MLGVWIFYLYGCEPHACSAHRDQRRYQILLNWNDRWLLATMWVVGIDPGSSGSPDHIVNHWTISPVLPPPVSFLKLLPMLLLHKNRWRREIYNICPLSHNLERLDMRHSSTGFFLEYLALISHTFAKGSQTMLTPQTWPKQWKTLTTVFSIAPAILRNQ